ncbi:hypothetical protein CFOL_v3_14725 [Cephalotus follicularis]|uniref:Uncharacterized protein n=1 Tax=Cephalotus follicularis TaxID=3775 RepID=A0A1Q3BTE0_CEPFO|nr:hypothetical protein CFOL_v3_14725 [Cephalotus follicularis]
MELKLLGDFLQILLDVYKISRKNVKLIASITILPIFLHSIIFSFNIFSIKPLFADLVVKQSFLLITSPNTPEFLNLLMGVIHDIKILFGVESIFLLAASVSSFLFSIATIFATAITYGGKNISINDLLSRTIKSWRRPFVTWFHTTLFFTGFNFFYLAAELLLMLIVYEHHVSLSKILLVVALSFLSYLSIVWNLAFVISVLEEIYGIEALGEATKIVKGMKLHGFLLNLLFAVITVILFQGLRLIPLKQSTKVQVIIGLLVVNSMYLVRMILMMGYTVLYYKCKKTLGEDVELQGSAEYVKIPTVSLIKEDIP